MMFKGGKHVTITIKTVFAFFVLNYSLIISASANDDNDFWLGILRNDGLLTPIEKGSEPFNFFN